MLLWCTVQAYTRDELTSKRIYSVIRKENALCMFVAVLERPKNILSTEQIPTIPAQKGYTHALTALIGTNVRHTEIKVNVPMKEYTFFSCTWCVRVQFSPQRPVYDTQLSMSQSKMKLSSAANEGIQG